MKSLILKSYKKWRICLWSLLIRYFGKKQVFPVQYITEKRFRKAMKKLMTDDFLISDISLLCGFGSQGYYATQFQIRYGSSPSHYRNLFSDIEC